MHGCVFGFHVQTDAAFLVPRLPQFVQRQRRFLCIPWALCIANQRLAKKTCKLSSYPLTDPLNLHVFSAPPIFASLCKSLAFPGGSEHASCGLSCNPGEVHVGSLGCKL